MNMNTQLAIIRSEGKEHLCYRDEECFFDVSYPMTTFTEGEDKFEIVKCNRPLADKTFLYQGKHFLIIPDMYYNGWLALCLKDPTTNEPYTTLTVNLTHEHAFSLPDKAFIDINNNPDAMEFLIANKLAEDTGYKKQSGWVNYPMVRLNLPLLYRLDPAAFHRMMNIQ